MSKHTPGPWKAAADKDDGGFVIMMGSRLENEGAFQAIHELIYVDNLFKGEKGYKEARANARLIAAAPDLLASLRELLAGAPYGSEAAVYQRARAAVLKAEGGE